MPFRALLLATFAGAFLLVAPAIANAQVTRDAAACESLRTLRIPGLELEITSAQWIPAGAPTGRGGRGPGPASPLPAYCRLDGMLDRRTGGDGNPYGIGFALALPGDWNGRFLFQGGGGLNGSVQTPLGAVASGDMPALARGFAVVSTDTGHQGQGAFDGRFQAEQQASLDFAYQAVGRVAVLAKQIIAQHYARPAHHSYFAGCSTGGREAMLMAQRYPTYFDGVISGAPAMRTGFSGIGDAWVATTLNQIAPRNDQGVPVTREALSEANKRAIIDGFLRACDGLDGVEDGMVFATRSCRFDPRALACSAGNQEGCLTAAQADAVARAFAGPTDSRGTQVYPGFLYDTGIAATQGLPGLLHGGQVVGGGGTGTEMDVDARAARAAANPASLLADTSTWTNLNTFSEQGSKLVFFHGVSDPWFSALDTVDYYERMTAANGGSAAVQEWSRLYLVPGMGHCSGGPAALDRFDLLTAVVDWVEEGVVPDAVVSEGAAFPGRTRPLCSYPQHAHFTGSGDPQDALNYVCRE